MATAVNIYEAKKSLSKIIDDVGSGKGEYIICKYGKPQAKIIALSAADLRPKAGFAKEYFDSIGFVVPNDFNSLGQDEIIALFEGQSK